VRLTCLLAFRAHQGGGGAPQCVKVWFSSK